MMKYENVSLFVVVGEGFVDQLQGIIGSCLSSIIIHIHLLKKRPSRYANVFPTIAGGMVHEIPSFLFFYAAKHFEIRKVEMKYIKSLFAFSLPARLYFGMLSFQPRMN